jgi:toxin ParE1/3/4
MSYRLTPAAEAELEEIGDRIALEDPLAAVRLIDALYRRWELLAEYPLSGAARDDIRPGLPYVVVGNYLSLYRIVEGDVEIVRVVHGRRDLHNL